MIVIDTETSGLDSRKHSILSIGAVEFENPENYFYGECRLREGAEIDLQALNVNGFTEEEIKNKEKSCKELLEEFLIWVSKIDDRTFAGMATHFDFAFLFDHCNFYGLHWPFKHRTVDLHSVFYFNLLRNKKEIPLKDNVSYFVLDNILKYLKIDNKERKEKHNALEDARLTAKAFSILLNNNL